MSVLPVLAVDYVTFQRGARLITEVPPAERK
jgi:hypothetical protein